MKKTKFQTGQQVCLKSGGPKMTVANVYSDMDPIEYHCQWFAGPKLNSNHFIEGVLEASNEEK